jgi:branched-chain amino acid transport system permease protein
VTTVLQIIFSGLAAGAIYGLIAVGYAIGYSVSGVINFAQGQLLMVGAMVAAVLYTSSLPLALVAAPLAAAAVGTLVYVAGIWPVLGERSSGGFSWLVSTLGLAIILQAIAAMLWGTSSRPFPHLLNDTRLSVGGASITLQSVLAVACILAVGVVLETFRRRSLLGRAGMAVALDSEAASAVGINPQVVHLVAFAVAGLLAGVAAVLVGPVSFANPYMGAGYGVKGFVALLLGGITNPTAAIGGGFILGLVEATAAVVFGPSTVDWFPLVVLVIVLVVAPNGVFGKRTLRLATA